MMAVLFIALLALMITIPIEIFVFVYYFWVKLYISNFVPTDEYDVFVNLPENLRISSNLLKKIFLHKNNVYETELDGERYCLYLTKKGKSDLKLHICGMENEQEHMLTLIREKHERGEKVTLPLTFEGKFVGNAEVLEIFEPIKSNTML